MQEQAFRNYLYSRYPNKSTASTQLSDARTAERAIGEDLDDYLAHDADRSLPDGLKSWHRSAVNRYREFLRENGDYEEISGELNEDTAPETDGFSLEADLQRSLRDNLGQLAPGLRIADNGSERSVATGRIDILARDSNDAWWVIELKAGTANDRAVSQLAAYMGALQEEETGNIRGLLIARDFTEKTLYAARMIPMVALKRYGFTFTFEDIS